jgi:Family of unknown function (DUF6252)
MKKLLAIFIAFVALVSCENDVRTNTPAFQGELDNVFWRAAESKVVVNADGSATISAFTEYEVITIEVPSLNPGIYNFNSSDTYASYTFNNLGVVKHFDTDNPDGSGQIEIKPSEAPGTISARLKFVGVDDNETLLNFNKGILYKVPIF